MIRSYKYNSIRIKRIFNVTINQVIFMLTVRTFEVNRLTLVRGLQYVSLLRPPVIESSAAGAEAIDKVEWKQVSQSIIQHSI